MRAPPRCRLWCFDGAGFAAGKLILGTLPGIDRPPLAVQLPGGEPFLLLDIGANPDSTAENLAQYARMGSIFAERVMGIPNPRVALLSIGEEKGKGDARIVKATELIEQTELNFIGNVEGRDLTRFVADVVVCDAVVGNVVIKFFEGLANYIFDLVRAEFYGSLRGRIAGLLMLPSMARIRTKFDHEVVGGTTLLGVNGTMINQNDANAELISKLGYKTVAVIHDTTDYGKGHNEYFSKALDKIGKAKIVGTFGVTADQQDFTAELTKIKALNPDVIYFGGLTPIGVRIRSQMDKLGIRAVFDGTSGIVSDAYVQGLGPLAEGTLAFREGAPTDKLPGGKFFMEKYNEQKYDSPPEAYGAFAYAATVMILDAIEKVGPERKKVIAELENVKDRDSIVGKITFDDHGQNTVPVITKYVVQDGKFVEWDESEYASGKRKLPGQK